MDPLAPVLDAHRRRLRLLRAAEAAARGAFWVSLAAGVALLVARLASLPLGGATAFAALALAAALLAGRELLRRFTRRDCAVELDRQLGLEERLATALEGAGTMKELQAADAAAALSRARVPAWRAPREAKWLAGSLALMLALSLAPMFEGRGDAETARLEVLLEEKAAAIEALAPERIEFKEVAEALRDGRVDEALAGLQKLREMLAAKAATEGAAGAEARRQEDALGEAARGLGAELGRAGRPVHASAPAAADARGRRLLESAGAVETGGLPPELRAAAMEAKDWDPRYDAVVKRYFRGTP